MRIESDPDELHNSPNEKVRWYRALWFIGKTGEYKFPGLMRDKAGKVVGEIITGSIDQPAEASANLCLRLEAREINISPTNNTPENTSILRFIIPYCKEIIIGIIVTVIGGLILAILL